ncbi:MAG: major capsid protein, partial [Nocardioidaceae bacterium]
FSAASQLLDAIGLAVQDLRDAYRLPESEQVEVVLPMWVREVLRADVGRRNGQVALDVADSVIALWIARRGAVAQYVYDWQPLGDAGIESPGDSPSEDCPPTPQTAFPTTVRFMAYRTGTWVTATTDVINLNAFYDHSLVTENKYGIQFTETGFALMNSCPGSRVYTASICPDGSTGGTDELSCSSQPIT